MIRYIQTNVQVPLGLVCWVIEMQDNFDNQAKKVIIYSIGKKWEDWQTLTLLLLSFVQENLYKK